MRSLMNSGIRIQCTDNHLKNRDVLFSESKVAIIFAARIGLVAQLDRASDYGSEGSRFESWQGHTYQKHHPKGGAFFIQLAQ